MNIFYDAQESANEASACAQIEYDKLCLLYSIGCESDTAGDNMHLLCAAFGVGYEALQNFTPALFTLHTTKANHVNCNINPWHQRLRQVNQLAQP